MCWGSYKGPHVHDIPLADIVDIILSVKAEGYSIEASNPRHDHEYEVWQDVKLPEGKLLIPGVIGHANDFIEHPELVAQRLVRYAEAVGRENVMAGTDCGIGSRGLGTRRCAGRSSSRWWRAHDWLPRSCGAKHGGLVTNQIERILTTHTGSLPRPPDLLAMIQAKETGQPYDAEELAAAVRRSVAETVREQAASGVDIVNDGEFSKAGFSDYIKDRVSGLGGVDPSPQAPTEVDFPEFAEWWRGVGFLGSVAFPRPLCVGSMAWTHPETVEADLANFRDALDGVDVAGAFMTASSPGILDLRIANQHYPTEEAYVYALAEMMKVEYRAIADAGFVLQVDAPEMAMGRNWARFRDGSLEDFRRVMGLWVEALNYALEGIPGGTAFASTSAGATTRGRMCATCLFETSSTSCCRCARARTP